MNKFVLLAAAAATVAGTAFAAAPKTHVMNVALPDGSTARVEYVGDVAPKVTVDPVRSPTEEGGMFGALPAFAGFDRIFEQMNRETQAMMRQVQQMQVQPGTPGMNVASYGSMPAGSSSVSVVSYSNGSGTCTRTTEVVSQGAGKQPKVTERVSGNCAAGGTAGPRAPAPPEATGSIDHT